MGTIICIYNLKGGVGKTTTTLNLAASFWEQNHSVLMIDMDSQASLTVHCGFPLFSRQQTIYHALLGQATLQEVMRSVHPILNEGFVDLIPAELDLIGAERELFTQNPMWGGVLYSLLQPIKQKYDYILIDCPASALVLTTNAVIASDVVLCPLQCESVNLHVWQLVAQKIADWEALRKLSLPYWIVRTLQDRTNHSQQASQAIKDALQDRVLDTIIKRRTDVANAMSHYQPVLQYDYHSEAAGWYRQLAIELKEVLAYG